MYIYISIYIYIYNMYIYIYMHTRGDRGDGPIRGLPDDTGRLGRPQRTIGDLM